MEHRYSRRRPADFKAVIYRNDMPVALGRVRNLGGGGLFIESYFGELSVNQPLEIEIFSADNDFRNNRLRAIVVHRTGDGFGAEVEESPDTLESSTPFQTDDLMPDEQTSLAKRG